MKTPEDTINRFINEENVQFNQERDDWMIEAMEEYAKEYAESEVKKLGISLVSFAKRKVCSIGINYEKCSEHPLNELGCSTCEKYIEQT